MRRTRSHGVFAVVLAGLAAACSSNPPPKSVTDAKNLLERAETEELSALRPKLIEEARDYEASAQQAYDDGDEREAELYGHMAVQRWQTAQNLVRRQSAQALIKNMTRARDEAASDEARRRQELARIHRLLGRIDQLAAPQPTDDAAVIAAKKSLLEARRKQAEADAVGAPVKAPNPYNQGATLLAGAIESFEFGMIDDSTKNSAGAIAAFGVAIDEARAAKEKPPEAVAAAAETAPPSALPPPAMPPAVAPLPPLSVMETDGALRAIHEAEDARADALGRGGASDPSMAHGNALLDLARRARNGGDDGRAIEKAKDARRVFAMVRGRAPVSASVEERIASLEARRVDLLSEGGATTCTSYEAFRTSLDMARARLDAKDEVRAQEFALLAQQKLRECEHPSGFGKAQRGSKEESDKPSAEDKARKRAANAIQKAQGNLAEAQVKLGDDDRLPPVAQVVTSAEGWYDRKEYIDAEDLANRASKQLAELMRKPAARAEPARTRGEPERGRGATEEQAATSIVDAQRTQADLEGRLGDDERLRRPAQLIESAERWFERREYDRAFELSKDARRAQREILGEKLRPGQAKPAEPVKPPPGGEGAAICREARAAVDDARVAARAASPREVGKAQLQTANALVRTAQDLVRKEQCASARDLAKQAIALATGEPARGTEPGRRPPEPRGAEPGRRTPEARGTEREREAPEARRPRRPPGGGEVWRDAYEAQMRALERRDEAREVLVDAAEPVFDSGEEALQRAKRLYDRKDYEPSEDAANDAVDKFELAIDASRAAGGPEPTRRERSRKPDESSPEDEGPTAGRARRGAPPKKADVKARSEQVILAYERSPEGRKAPSAWKGAYRQIIATLALRDRVTPMAKSKPAKDAVSRGGMLLTKARAAYKQKRYTAAEELAMNAAAELQAVLDAQAPLSAPPEVQDDGSEEFKATDQALREVQVLLEVCAHEKCPERDFKAYAKARQLAESARAAFKDRKYDYAKELAAKAKAALEGALEKPSAPAPPKPDTAEKQKQKLAAEDAVREANVLFKLCDQKGCDKQNLETWLRSTSLMNASKASFADQLYDRAKEQADEAHRILRDLLDAKPKGLVTPQGLNRVRIDGNKIVAQPPIDFRSGGAVLTQNGKAAVAEIATLLKANLDQIDGVTIVGHTDSRGNPKLNRTLSANRARAVMQALVNAGISGGLMTAEGRGADQPIADNATEEGRRANRRVDITVRTK